MLGGPRYGGYGEPRESTFTLDEAFLFAEENVHSQKEEPAYLKQAKCLEKQLATEDTLIESLLGLLIKMSESSTHQVQNASGAQHHLENANASELLLLLSNVSDLKSNNQHLNRNKLSNAVAMLLKMEFEKNSKFKDLILDNELVEEQKQEQPAAQDAKGEVLEM